MNMKVAPFACGNQDCHRSKARQQPAADAAKSRSPASLHGFTMISGGWPFADSARDSVASGSRMHWFQKNHY